MALQRPRPAGTPDPEIQERGIRKAPTGIPGLDEITQGGLPAGRTTLVCGGAGCGKTLLAMEFLIRGAVEFGEPGVFVAFEEKEEELIANVASLGFDLGRLIAERRILVDHVRVEREEIEEAGEYDLEGLFVRIGFAVDSIGAKRVALDTLEALFSAFQNEAVLRAELRRLFRWLKDRGLTAVVTGERGERALTRRGLEEYVSDCVILLDHRVHDQVSTRRLRIVKYRGSAHGANEYPFLIDEHGIAVLPITSARLDHPAPAERVSTGIEGLDALLDGGGFYRGSSVLVSGAAGTGKTSFCAHAVSAACARGEKCLYLAFEESPAQIVRNMRSIGVDLEPHVKSGLLRLQAARPTLYGLETHLALAHRLIDRHEPALVVVDPVTSLTAAATAGEAYAMLMRLLELLKSRGITGLYTGLTSDADAADRAALGVSSLIDTWLLLEHAPADGERRRCLTILKSRGMAHSTRVHEFRLTGRGVRLADDDDGQYAPAAEGGSRPAPAAARK